MQKKQYAKPAILSEEKIAFETLISCNDPNQPGEIHNGQIPICVRPDNTWFPR